jgi:phage terminase small subunit
MPSLNAMRVEVGQPDLTEKQRLFAKHVAQGREVLHAAKMAGYHTPPYEIAKRPDFIAFVKKLQARNERVVDMTRKKVMEGFLEAIEQAKMMAEPMTQIAGWREIAKVCGYYAPEVKILNINATSQRVLTQLETLSDSDLLEIIEKDAELIEGEVRHLMDAEVVPEAPAEASEPLPAVPDDQPPETAPSA